MNLKIFDRKFHRGLVGYKPGPKPHLYLKLREKKSVHKKGDRQKELKLHFVAIVFLEGPLRCDPSRFIKKK